MSDLINNRLKIHTVDNRTYTGTLLSFDKHLNLVLADTEEARITKKFTGFKNTEPEKGK